MKSSVSNALALTSFFFFGDLSARFLVKISVNGEDAKDIKSRAEGKGTIFLRRMGLLCINNIIYLKYIKKLKCLSLDF